MSSQEKIVLKTYEPFVAEMAAKYEVDAFIVWNILDHFTRRAPSEREKAREAVIEAAKDCRLGHVNGKIVTHKSDSAGTDERLCRLVGALANLAALGDA